MTKINKTLFIENLSKGDLPLIIPISDRIDYLFSYAQDSPFFRALSENKLLGTKCKKCSYAYATARTHCKFCGSRCNWVELPKTGAVHTFTSCYYSTSATQGKIPYNLVLVEFSGFDTFFLSQLKNIKESEIKIGMKVRAKFKGKPQFNANDIWFVPVK